MPKKKVTFGNVNQLLSRCGFEKPVVTTSFVAFEHKPSGCILTFRPHQPGEEVDAVTLSIVRKKLDWNGILEEAKFEEALHQAAVNGAARSRRRDRQDDSQSANHQRPGAARLANPIEVELRHT
jgi:hypothetical protein